MGKGKTALCLSSVNVKYQHIMKKCPGMDPDES